MANRYHPYNNGAGKGGGKSWSKSGGKAESGLAFSNAPWHWNSTQGANKKVCSYFLQGTCKKGAACDFSHEASSPQSQNGQLSEMSRSAGVKRKMCAYFAQGTCKKGASCDFAHNEFELQPEAAAGQAYPSSGNAAASGHSGNRRICTFFLQGNCKKGAECDFSHESDAAMTESAQIIREDDARYKTILCWHFEQSSGCPKGDTCSFAHGSHELRGDTAAPSWVAPSRSDPVGSTDGNTKSFKKMCDAWLQGYCAKGDACNLIHGKSSVQKTRTTYEPALAGVKMRLCTFFMQDGYCKKGVECDFAHGEHELNNEVSQQMEVASDFGGASSAVAVDDARYKTILCRHFSSPGGCERGAACNFAHGPEELRQRDEQVPQKHWPAELRQSPVDTLERLPLRETRRPDDVGVVSSDRNFKKMCDDWLQGFCRKGDACNLIHGKTAASGSERQIAGAYHDLAGPAFKSRLCSFFMDQGFCRKGDTCDFAHGEHELQADGSQDVKVAAEFGSTSTGPAPFKTRMCNFFLQGACSKGASCTFAHGEHELQSQAAEQVLESDAQDGEAVGGYKTKMCAHYTKPGGCYKGAACTFAHGEHELANFDQSMETTDSGSRMCRYFLQGACKKGAECDFSHGEPVREPLPDNYGAGGGFKRMCKYFLQGSCKKGDTCDFSHEEYAPPSGITQEATGQSPAKRRLCQYFIQGICKKGNDCDFPHDRAELDPSEAPKIIKPPKRPIAEMVAEKKNVVKVEKIENNEKIEKVEKVANYDNPDDWEALEDEDGEVYYHHMPSGRTQWEPPKLPPILQAGAEVSGTSSTSDVQQAP